MFLLLFILFEPYSLTVSLFERALAAHNFLAFLSFFVQWRGLIGSRGIAPVHALMRKLRMRGWTWKSRWHLMPTLFWYSDTDEMILYVQLFGLLCSSLAFFGIFPGWMILLTSICYSSIKCVGSVFTQLQMHAHIMEIDVIYVCCAPFLHVAPSSLVVLASLLNFRVMMGGGAGKWFGGDTSWRDGTAMAFHFWTQPLPNPISPFFHRLPLAFHKMETWTSMIFESICSLFVFAPIYLRFIAFGGFMSVMLMINLTGNFAQISVLTINECILLLNDDVWNYLFDVAGSVLPGMNHLRRWLLWTHQVPYCNLAFMPTVKPFSLWNMSLAVIPYACFILPYALIQLIPLINTFRSHNALELFEPWSTKPLQAYRDFKQSIKYKKYIEPKWNKLWDWIEKGYTYGNIVELFGSYVKFGHMTKFRHEIIIESSLDGVTWHEYTFRYKPSLVTKRPPFFPVHLPAYDWRLWFLPLEAARGGDPPLWFMRSLMLLLECEKDVMDLFLSVPFNGLDTPKPDFIRAVLYDYRFAYKYEDEDTMKQLVKTHHIRDTEIDTESEEEIEVDAEPTHRAPPGFKAEEEKDTSVTDEKQMTHAKQDTRHDAGETKVAHDDDATDEAEEEAERPSQTTRSRHTHRSPPHERDDDDEDEPESDRHRLAREALERLLGIHLPASSTRRRAAAPGKVWKRIHKVTHPVPQHDAMGKRVWYVRRHRVGPYGPTLTRRPAPTHVQANEPQEWEGFLEEQE